MSESPKRNGDKNDGEKRIRLLEDILIILCILPLWPAILSWRHPAFEYVMYVALVGLVVIFFRRVKRFRQVREELDD
jgi:hypothetical protein